MASTEISEADTDNHVFNEPSCTGEDVLAVSFLPSCPTSFFPQFQKAPSDFIASPVLPPADARFAVDHQSFNKPTCIGPDCPFSKVLLSA